jgi:hypothetical protein
VSYHKLDTPPIEAQGSALRKEICRNAEAVYPFDMGVRQPATASRTSAPLAGRPWNPCDWRGLAAGPDGWSQALRRFDVTVRNKASRDYLCGEDAKGKPDAERIRMCKVAGVEEKWIAKLPEAAKEPPTAKD